MPQFEQKYTDDEEFLKLLRNGLKTTGYVTKKIGCARRTAEVHLNRLSAEGKVEKIEIDDGLNHVWQAIEQ